MKWISPIKATINQFIAMSSAQSHEELQRRICELESKLSVFEANPHNLPHEELEYKNMIQHMLHEVHYWEVVRDDRGKIRSWKLINANLAAIKSWGVSLSDVVGKNAEEIFRDGDPLGQFMPIVEKIISEQKPHIWEQYFPGTNQVLQMVSIPHGDRFISTGLDVTKQKKMEDALNHSRKMDSIAQLANGISHEFNNQLTVMMGYADLLLEKLKDEELKAYVTGIRHTASRSATLTSLLSNFSRTGHTEQTSFKPDDLIRETIDILHTLVSKNITIRENLHAHDASILADRSQIQNILLNLAFNSRDAMPGGGSITFETRTVSLNQESQVLIANELTVGNYVKVTVRDEGCGISPEIKHRIFEPFFTTKPQGEGMGMALASAYGIAKRQGGTITVDRGDGKGAAFHVYLAMGTDDESRPYSELTNGGITSKSSLNILLVDDEALILDLSSQILRMMGHVVTTASNGKEALDIYERDHQDIDLVIVDMSMPVMDGLAVFREMKRINQNVNLIVASGYAQEGRIQTAMDEGAFGFLPKPYTKDQLLDAIRKTKART